VAQQGDVQRKVTAARPAQAVGRVVTAADRDERAGRDELGVRRVGPEPVIA
jgi:hypothetical protein